MERQGFIKSHWKGKLITQSAPHFTLTNVELTENIVYLLSEVGLPIILPTEKKNLLCLLPIYLRYR